MPNNPSVSVVIPTYNNARFVTEAVDSVIAQTVAADEIIVVDDGSTDATREALRSYDKRIRYIYQPNAGPSRARNRGIEESRGTLIAFLDADDRWLPGKLAKQLECLAANPDVDLIHSEFLHWDDRNGDLTFVPQGRERYTGSCYLEFFWHCRVLTSTALVTRRSLDAVGLFDDKIPGGYAEDLDLFMRIARRFSLALVAEPLVHYRHHGSNATLNNPRMSEGVFYVLERAAKGDPQIAARLGADKVRNHLRDLAFLAGYAHSEAGDLRRARGYFRSALRFAPGSAYLWSLWGSTFLPHGARQLLRAAKQRLGSSSTGQRSSPELRS